MLATMLNPSIYGPISTGAGVSLVVQSEALKVCAATPSSWSMFAFMKVIDCSAAARYVWFCVISARRADNLGRYFAAILVYDSIYARYPGTVVTE